MRSEIGRRARTVPPKARKSQEDGEVAQIREIRPEAEKMRERNEKELREMLKKNERDDTRLILIRETRTIREC